MSTQAALDFDQAVRAYLAPHQAQFNYELLVKNHTDSSRFGPWIEQVNAYHEVKGARVLSSGCGSGGDIDTFLLYGAENVCGIEVDSSLIELAKQRFAGTANEARVSLTSYAGDHLPYSSNSFDIIFSLHVIEHTKNVGLYLSELLRVLAPGGVIFLDLPNRYFKYEQHINVPYIHFLPRQIRNQVVRTIVSKAFPLKLSEDMRYKIGSMYDYHIPSPSGLMAALKGDLSRAVPLKIRDAFFHSYSTSHLDYDSVTKGYFSGQARRETTFRLVIEKI